MNRTLPPLVILLACAALSADDFSYQQPSRRVSEVLNAAPTPVASVSPQHDSVLFLQGVRYPPITEVAQPMLRLAGIRIDVNTNGQHLAPYYRSMELKRLPQGTAVNLEITQDIKAGTPAWSPDGKQFAFTNTTMHGIELWIGSAGTGKTRRVDGARVNGVRVGNAIVNPAIEWLGDNRTLLVALVPAGRGPVPVESAFPKGPHVQESLGHAGPAPTYEDLLSTPHEEDLFDYYATAQPAYVDTVTGKVTRVGKPGIYTALRPSPDQKHLLAGWLHRPYSYQLPATLFPQEVEVWDRNGKTEYKVASLAMAERVPLAGVRTGPRSYQWLPHEPASLVWAEALDGGNPREKVPHRDKIARLAAPFAGQPEVVFETEQRFRGMQELAGGKALVEDYDRLTRVVRTIEIDLARRGNPSRVVFSRNERDAYHDPGAPVTKTAPAGQRQVVQAGDEIYLSGQGASPAGDKPFLDRFNPTTGNKQRLFESSGGYEEMVAMLDDTGSRLLTRRQSPTDPPNYYLREGQQLKPLTHYSNPTPQTAGIRKQLVTYKRKDGVPLSFTLYLPPSYQPGTRLPTLMWAYPYEFSDADTAGQVTGHEEQSFPELTYHQLPVLQGYALLDNAAMPIIGDPDTVNNTYVEQLVMDAQAAVDKAVEMGVTDRNRVGVFGHSYGAFMTANLLAHSSLFLAAVAESGAYNRTLTPFGFQSERRTFWEAPDVYTRMSPFWFADKIKTPLLLIHGEADDNTGTFPIQSERLYAAVRGNGGTVRLVMLPAEAHGYRGKESLEHVLSEELAWFDKFLK